LESCGDDKGRPPGIRRGPAGRDTGPSLSAAIFAERAQGPQAIPVANVVAAAEASC
jgi:hypothetical protein